MNKSQKKVRFFCGKYFTTTGQVMYDILPAYSKANFISLYNTSYAEVTFIDYFEPVITGSISGELSYLFYINGRKYYFGSETEEQRYYYNAKDYLDREYAKQINELNDDIVQNRIGY